MLYPWFNKMITEIDSESSLSGVVYNASIVIPTKIKLMSEK